MQGSDALEVAHEDPTSEQLARAGFHFSGPLRWCRRTEAVIDGKDDDNDGDPWRLIK